MTAIAIDNVAAFGVEALGDDTAMQIEGGLVGWRDGVVGILATIAYEFLNDPGGAARAFMEGFNATSS